MKHIITLTVLLIMVIITFFTDEVFTDNWYEQFINVSINCIFALYFLFLILNVDPCHWPYFSLQCQHDSWPWSAYSTVHQCHTITLLVTRPAITSCTVTESNIAESFETVSTLNSCCQHQFMRNYKVLITNLDKNSHNTPRETFCHKQIQFAKSFKLFCCWTHKKFSTHWNFDRILKNFLFAVLIK